MDDLTPPLPRWYHALEAGRLRLTPPRTRAECASIPRPCTRFRCRYNLHTDLNRNGKLVLLSLPEQGTPSCALDVAAGEEVTLEVLGDWLDVTRERIRQIEKAGLRRFKAALRRVDAQLVGELEREILAMRAWRSRKQLSRGRDDGDWAADVDAEEAGA